MTIGEVVSRLSKAKRTGKGYNALCPAHDDRSPSLSIAEGSGGKILLKCFRGCSTGSILNAIGLEMKDLFAVNGMSIVRLEGDRATTTPKAAKAANTPKTIAAVYSYADADGAVLYENVRYQPKDFRQRRPDGSGGFINNLDGIDRVPYRLPELIEHLKTTSIVAVLTRSIIPSKVPPACASSPTASMQRAGPSSPVTPIKTRKHHPC